MENLEIREYNYYKIEEEKHRASIILSLTEGSNSTICLMNL